MVNMNFCKKYKISKTKIIYNFNRKKWKRKNIMESRKYYKKFISN